MSGGFAPLAALVNWAPLVAAENHPPLRIDRGGRCYFSGPAYLAELGPSLKLARIEKEDEEEAEDEE